MTYWPGNRGLERHGSPCATALGREQERNERLARSDKGILDFD